MSSQLRGQHLSPRVAVALIAVASFALWGALGHAASVPRFFMDELEYTKTGVSIAQGHGLQFEGTSWGFGPAFPLLAGAIVRLTSNQEVAYELLKAANALFFALATIPVYLLSRRLLPPWPSVAVVALSAAIPSTMYASVAMTESLGYLLACWSIYAIALALERPSVTHQAAAVGAMIAAIATRPQLVALYGGYLLGLGALLPSPAGRHRRRRVAWTSLWPTALSVAVGLAWLAWPVAHGHGVGRSLGSYSVLAHSYDPPQVAKWFAYHLGLLALYLGVVPVAIAPVVVTRWWAGAREGELRKAVFLSQFVAQNVVGIGLIAAFASTPAGLGILYDRYLFYLVPLWLLALGVWLHDGLPRPPRPLAFGAAAAIVLVATLPYDVVGRHSWFQHFEAVATGMWGTAQLPLVSLRTAGVLFAVAAITAVVLVPRRRRWILPWVVGLVLAANLSLSWRSAFVDASGYGLSPPGSRAWVDDRLGQNASVTVLIVARTCSLAAEERFAGLETDFFNRSVRARATLGGEGGGAPTALDVLPDGRLARHSGAPLTARYVVAPAGVRIHGRLLAIGMVPHLVLWDAGSPVRVENATSTRQLLLTRCTG